MSLDRLIYGEGRYEHFFAPLNLRATSDLSAWTFDRSFSLAPLYFSSPIHLGSGCVTNFQAIRSVLLKRHERFVLLSLSAQYAPQMKRTFIVRLP